MATLGPVNERTSARYTATLEDETGAVVPASALLTLTLTVYDVETGTKINSRDSQNVLNTNGVSISEAGALVWTLEPADNIIVSTALLNEKHRALFRATWGSGRGLTHEVDVWVKNVGLVT